MSETGPLASFYVRAVTVIVSHGDVSPYIATRFVTDFMSPTIVVSDIKAVISDIRAVTLGHKSWHVVRSRTV